MSSDLLLILTVLLIGIAFIYLSLKIIKKNNDLFIVSLTNANKSFAENFKVSLRTLLTELEDSQATFLNEHKASMGELKNNINNFSTTIAEYSKDVKALNGNLKKIYETNEKFLSELKGVAFGDFKEISTNLTKHIQKFKELEATYNRNNENIVSILMSLKSLKDLLEQSNINIKQFETLSNKIDGLNKKFQDSSLKMEVVNRSLTNLSENKLAAILNKYSNIIPELNIELVKLSGNLYDKFEETIDKFDAVTKNLGDISEKYRETISGTRRDEITGEFLDV